MNINQLKYFQTVCYQESVTKAAEQLHISQPSISTALKSLEDELNVSLFIRDHKKIAPNQTGEFFLEKVNYILNLFEQLPDEVKAFEEEKKYIVKIGISALGAKTFSSIFEKLQINGMKIRYQFQEHTKQKTKELLRSEELDFGIILLEPEDRQEFSFISLMDVKVCSENTTLLFDGVTNTSSTLSGEQRMPCYQIGMIWLKKREATFPFQSLPLWLETVFFSHKEQQS